MIYPSLERIIGRELKDSFGRYVGIIAGISTDGEGNIQSVGVDTGCNGFHKIECDRLTFEEDTPILKSEWKLESDSFLKTSGITEKKMLALQELYEEGEITQDVFEHLSSKHKAKLEAFSDKCEQAITNLNHKVESLSLENVSVNQFLGTLKLQHRIGDISNDVFRAANDYLGSILRNNEQEVSNISAILNNIAPKIIVPNVETQEFVTEATIESTDENYSLVTPEVCEVPMVTEEQSLTQEVSDETPQYVMPTMEAPELSVDSEYETTEIQTPDIVSDNNESITPTEEINTFSFTENVEKLYEEPQTESLQNQVTETFETTQESDDLQESTSFETPEVVEVSDITAADKYETEHESTSYETPEITEISEGLQIEETESTEYTQETTDSEEIDALEINDSVSFDENSSETIEYTPTEVTESEENSEVAEEKVIYSDY